MRPAPVHVNQFDAGGRFPNGASSTAYDCTVACGVMELDAATSGRIRVTTTQLRARQNDQDKTGIGLDDLALAYRRTPGAPTLAHGTRAWWTVRDRLRRADGAIMQGYYIALGTSRASSFRGPHALYAQRIDGDRALINDPIRRAAAWIPVAHLQRFYLSGIGQAGWSTGSGSSSGVSTPAPGATLGAWNNLITFPIGHVITQADVDHIERTLWNAGWFGTGPAAWIAVQTYHQVLMGVIGQPWSKALQDRMAAAAAPLAKDAGDPFGLATAAASVALIPGQLVAGFGEVFRNGILLVAILGLVLIGLWLVATAPDNSLPRPSIRIGA